MRNRIGGSSSASATTQNHEPESAIERLDMAIGNLQDARREATQKNPALALFTSRNKNTDKLLEQASAISANHHRNAGAKNDAMPDSTNLIDALRKR
ncbi:hypothetical protein [Ralstonia pseudosolanacearum]|uniref:hypothetical protein n=1 Tax=Ralstonia pseudosolanacearum TaxID=1310165 RepID=UPI0020054D8C|nr:hypothetical protein [Ralstonia pseudosolanacearum]MCK4154689.1 hypothetical protein [Ralstonia pseudosolanacearum]